MTRLPDVRALVALPFETEWKKVTGFGRLPRPVAQRQFDSSGLWWAVPFALGASGCHYAFRLAPGAGHGAVLRCLNGHAVTVASTPDRAVFAMLALERLLVGDKFRNRVQEAWSQVRPLLREAVSITGGNPDALDDILHLADHLPKWVYPTASEDEEQRRTMLWRMTNDSAKSGSTKLVWSRANDSRLAPTDADASLRLLQGNHGLDATHSGGGLMPDSKSARAFLVACARRVRDVGLQPDPSWARVINALAEHEQPEATDFIAPSIGVGPERAWDSLAAASFWFNAVTRRVPDEHTVVAEEIAEAAGALHILEARRLLA